ncbi:MAG: peptidylprolyl isomerase [Defluviitaleaceae bacterium]|nr:peptidylprolyl isomerase [Defluviitaleaceae bacterium]
MNEKKSTGVNKSKYREQRAAPVRFYHRREIIWLLGAVAVILLAVVVALFAMRDLNPPVATVNGLQIRTFDVLSEMQSAQQHVGAGVSYGAGFDERGAAFDREVREVREEAVRRAAIQRLMIEYAQQEHGIYFADAERAANDEINEFIQISGQHELNQIIRNGGHRNRDHLASELAADRVVDDLLMTVMQNPEAQTRFEAFMPEREGSATERANEIHARAIAGEDFDMLIATYGEDPGMEFNPDGYTFTAGDMVPEFEQGTRDLEIGEISPPVRSQFGYHIIKRVEPAHEGEDMLGAKHILIADSEPNEVNQLWDAMFSYFEAQVEAANIQLLRALNNVG